MAKRDNKKESIGKKASGLGMGLQSFLIASSLSTGPKHGYAISKQLEDDTQGKVQLGPGTLYGNLHKMESEGLVNLQKVNLVDGKVQKVYQLTEQGTSTLAEQTKVIKMLFNTNSRRIEK